MGAFHYTIRPAKLHHQALAILEIVEVENCLLECFEAACHVLIMPDLAWYSKYIIAQTSDRLRRCPTVLLRWFRRPRETRVRPFDEPAPPRSFREYLPPDHLPYYRRSDHLRANPAPLALGIRDEEQLLADLDRTDVTGLLLTGTGGLGKTRLMIELGRMARDLGWSVLRVADAWDILDLRRFADMIDPEARVLLLFDYIERQNVFAAIAHEIQEINSARFLNLRYIANCRTSYWGRSPGSSNGYHQFPGPYLPCLEPAFVLTSAELQ